MTIELQPVTVETGSPDQEGRLAFTGGRLVAILVKLADIHGDSGRWAVEWIGGSQLVVPPPFDDLGVAELWLADRFDGSGRW